MLIKAIAKLLMKIQIYKNANIQKK